MAGLRSRARNVPRGGDRQKDGRGEKQGKATEERRLPAKGEQERAHGKQQEGTDRAFGQQAQGKNGGKAKRRCEGRGCPGAGSRHVLRSLDGNEEKVNAERHPKGEDDVGNEETRVQVRAKRCAEGDGGVECGTIWAADGRDVGEETQAKRVSRKQQQKGEDGERKSTGPVERAEQMHAAGGQPVEQRWLVKEADAINCGRHEVVANQHLARDFEVHGVHVIQQARREQTAYIEQEPEQTDQSEGPTRPAASSLRSGLKEV